jgi:mannosyl-3-phosphoglycerate phosphatase
MLAPRAIIFTPSNLLGSSSASVQAASDALFELERRKIPLVLSGRGTRAQIEAVRRRIEHGHPFITEGGGGLFIPDGYFSIRMEGAQRAGRYLCVPFGRPTREAIAAIKEIADEANAEVVPYAEMSAREIARNTGMNIRDAEASADREFSQPFFFAGNSDQVASAFQQAANRHGWQVRRAQNAFWELFSGNDDGKALRYLMKLYRETLRSRLRSVGLGSSMDDLSLLAASDQRLVLPLGGDHYDIALLSKLPGATKISASGAAGWNQAVLDVLNTI